MGLRRCLTNCRLYCTECGNGIVELRADETREDCDDGNIEEGDDCAPDCTFPRCGNGFVDGGEVCDDFNTRSGDGCSADCLSRETCGNGYTDVALGELCDDGNQDPTDDCHGCTLTSCGDGTVQAWEMCDDGNNVDGDGCNQRCSSDERCGNGIIDLHLGEECDDGNMVREDGCGDCLILSCGNGRLDAGEACDDGNRISGDGCDESCQSTEHCGNGFLDVSLGEQCDDGNLLSRDGCSSTCTVEPLAWDTFAPIHADRTSMVLVYDEARGVTVMFGGRDLLGTPLNDTWEYDGTQWSFVVSAVAPSPRYRSAAAYDPDRGALVVWGGNPEMSTLTNDTWLFDGASWSLVTATGPSCSSTSGCGTMAYDRARSRQVLFQPATGQTWHLVGSSWQQVAAPGAPSATMGSTADMAYSPELQASVMVLSQPSRGTWLYDGSEWTEATSAQASTPDPWSSSLVYDSAVGRVLAVTPTATWSFNGTIWSEVVHTGPTPSRSGFGAAWDTARNRLVVVGGTTGSDLLGDLWEYDGSSWALRLPGRPATPEARSRTVMTYHPGLESTVLFSGDGNVGNEEARDTWLLQSSGWEFVPATERPTNRFDAGFTYDAFSSTVLLFGGHNYNPGISLLNDTWRFDGITWELVNTDDAPSPRHSHAIASSWVEQEILLFGGLDVTQYCTLDTWRFDGWTWRQLFPATVPDWRHPGRMPLMVHDAMRNRYVMIVPNQFTEDYETWEFTGRDWIHRTTLTRLPYREEATLSHDRHRGITLMVGG